MATLKQSQPDWQAHLNPALVARLARPQKRPGIIQLAWAQQLQRRVNGSAISSPVLANTLLQRRNQHSIDAGTLTPLVYPQRLETPSAAGQSNPAEPAPAKERSSLRRTVATRPAANPAMPLTPSYPPVVGSSPSLPDSDQVGFGLAVSNSPVTAQNISAAPTGSRPVVRSQISALSSVLQRLPQRPSIQPTLSTVQPMGNPALSNRSAPAPKQPIVQRPSPSQFPIPTKTLIPITESPLPPSPPTAAAKSQPTTNIPRVQASLTSGISPQPAPLVYVPMVRPVEQSSAGEVQRAPLSDVTQTVMRSPGSLPSFEDSEIEGEHPQPPQTPPQPPSVDEVVDKVLRKLSRRLAVEQERQGGQPWS